MAEFTEKERTQLAKATEEIINVAQIIEFTTPRIVSENLDNTWNHLVNIIAELELVRYYGGLYMEEKQS